MWCSLLHGVTLGDVAHGHGRCRAGTRVYLNLVDNLLSPAACSLDFNVIGAKGAVELAKGLPKSLVTLR